MLEVSRLWLLVVQELICDGYWIVLMLQILSNVCSPLLFIPAAQFSSPFLFSSFLKFLTWDFVLKKGFYCTAMKAIYFHASLSAAIIPSNTFHHAAEGFIWPTGRRKNKKMVYYCFLTAARKERFWKHASVRYRKIRGLGYNLHAHLVIITF